MPARTMNTSKSEVETKMDEYMHAMTRLGKFSGSVLVALVDRVVHRAGYGPADREKAIANTRDTKFRIASISKQFTAMAIMILEEQGKLSVYDAVKRHLPYSPDAWNEITLHNLLNHTSGLVRGADSPETRMQSLTLAETVDMFRGKPLEFRPGTRHEYSNCGYILLGDVIERVSGVSYDAFLRAHIFDPLEMADTGCDSQTDPPVNRAIGYARENGAWAPSSNHGMWWTFGAGGLYSTVDDLFRWDQALGAGRLISKEAHARMTTIAPLLAPYGYGFGILRQNNRRMISHAGGLPGFRSQLSRFPDEPACVIVLSNSETTSSFGVTGVLSAILFGEEYEIPAVKTAIDVARDVLDTYVGGYEIVRGVTLRVEHKDGRLSVTSGNARREFLPESQTVFFADESDDGLEFHITDSGAVTGLTLRQGDVEAEARKLRPA
jgi:CubicO group peptidase (beta-lactamase class C family)